MKRKIVIIVLLLLCIQFITQVQVHSEVSQDNFNSPILENGTIKPENGKWGDNFKFQITYVDKENEGPAQGYPRVYLNNSYREMNEKNPNNVNFSKGKKYEYTWELGLDYIGKNSFYFFVLKPSGENTRYPSDGRFSKPIVEKRVPKLTLDMIDSDNEIIFSGTLKDKIENKGLRNENIHLYNIFKEENNKLGNLKTNENGRFEFSYQYREERGIYKYEAYFNGTKGYKGISSNDVFITNIDGLYVFSLTLGYLLTFLFIIGYLLSRNIDFNLFVLPVILGSFLGVTLLPYLSFISILIGGIVTGYLVAGGGIDDWIQQLEVGVLGGFLSYGIYIMTTLVNVFFEGGGVVFEYSYTQGAFLQNLLIELLPTSVLFIIFIALGVVIGGRLKGFSK